jgi:hypothetical protein
MRYQYCYHFPQLTSLFTAARRWPSDLLQACRKRCIVRKTALRLRRVKCTLICVTAVAALPHRNGPLRLLMPGMFHYSNLA